MKLEDFHSKKMISIRFLKLTQEGDKITMRVNKMHFYIYPNSIYQENV